ncbi:LAME_0G11782g1_1 [Lachancea meyersii CBS 8951]|uniref:LAME_0G11782g1_1 n=1 Tax=Lachancea meyersii CBS 8951 TaxID=1266667 RepID=A0A1G4K9F5_9SACH|nr:LAME_0G11782g1_1 [Lachancea meyersii CBS 8951]
MKAVVEHVQLQFIPEIDNNVASLCVEQNVMCFALKTGFLFVIDLATPSKVTKFKFPLLAAPQEKILKVWMDPSGSTLFLKTNFAKYYSLTRTSLGADIAEHIVHLKRLCKKNCDVLTITWVDASHILCGTQEGNVYWVDLEHENSVSRVYKSKTSVDGLVYSKGQCAFLSSKDTIRFWSNIDDSLKFLSGGSVPETEQFEELEAATGKKLTFYNNTFAWIAGPGVVSGSTGKQDGVLSAATVLLAAELPPSTHKIKDVLLSKYHILILRGNELVIVNKLNNAVVDQKSVWTHGSEKIVEFTADYSQNPPTFWCYSASNIFEIIMQNEEEGIWNVLSKQGRFDEALRIEKLTLEEKNQIYLRKANQLYSQGEFVKAAENYGKTSSITTGEVGLKFIKDPTKVDALQTYLLTKLEDSKSQKNNEVQLILLSNWIVWNFVQMLNAVDDSISSEQNANKLELLHARKKELKSVFKDFLAQNLSFLDKDTIYQIMSHQNRKMEVLTFAKLVKDYKYVLSYWIRSKNWYESLKVLMTTQDLECIYKYATTLLINSPDATVNTWMQIPSINPSELVNPLLTYFAKFQKLGFEMGPSRSNINYALKYLMWCFKEYVGEESLDPVVYNAALYMMIAAYDAKNKEDDIIAFIEGNMGHFDNDFVLRLSNKFQRYKVSVYLYSQLKLFEEAVTLAVEKGLLGDAKLVVTNRELDSNFRLRRKLWLKIAKYMMCDQSDIQGSIKSILRDSNDTLTIKDLLPLFNELTTIANVKDELIRNLEKHSSAMIHITHEIKESIKIKKEIAEDIELLKTRYQTLEPGASCGVCGEILQTRKFYVFPCGHSFHTDCLMKEILKSTDYSLRNKIEAFQRAAAKEPKGSADLKELDRLLSTKCCFCSDIKINSIDEPLDLSETERQAWCI